MATGGLGLLLERAELTPDFAHEIADAGQIAIGGQEATLGPLLALPEFQDTGGFLDDRPAILGASIEHRVDLALRDDHVLLATHTAVRQQIGDVEQPARNTVDGVFGLTVAKQRAGDLDLVELDR